MRIYTASIMRYYKDVITDWITTQGAPAIIRKDLPPMMNAFPPTTEFPLDPAGAEDVLTAPTSFGPSFPSEFPFEDEPHKGKKKGKKGKKARKKAAKRARKRATERQIALANYRCGYLAAENDMLRKMIALSVGVKRGSFNDKLAADGLKLLPGGDR